MGYCRVKNKHLKARDGWLHYRRRVPEDVASAFGRSEVAIALKTRDTAEARKRRDRLDAQLERRWQKLREAAARTARAPEFTSDEESNAYAAYVHYQQHNVEGAHSPAPYEIYFDQLDDLASRVAEGVGGEDLDEARELVSDTPEGKRLAKLIAAAQGRVSIAMAGEKFLAVANLRESTKRLYRGVYKIGSEYLPQPEHVTKRQAREFIQSQAKDATGPTLSNYRSALRQLWDHLGLDKNIWSGFRVDPGKSSIERVNWENEEIVQLLEGASRKLRLAILIAAFTGAREEEIATMLYDAKNDHITFPKSKTKAGERTIPCPNAIREVVKEWVAAPWSKFTIRNRFSELKTELKFPPAKVFHSFRHTVSSRLHNCHVQEATAAKIVGHKHPSLTYGWYGNKVHVETLRGPINLVQYSPAVLAFISTQALLFGSEQRDSDRVT